VNDPRVNRRERAVAWQNKYLTPGLLIIAIVAIALVWAVGGIPWWLAMGLLFFGGVVLVGSIYRSVGRR